MKIELVNEGSVEIRTKILDGESFFVAKDVCQVFGISNYRDAVSRLEEDYKKLVSVDTPGGRQKMTAINQGGFFLLIFQSRGQEAKKLQKALVENVFPKIILEIKNSKKNG